MAYEIILKPRKDAKSDQPVKLNVDGYFIDLFGGKSSFTIGSSNTEIPTGNIISVQTVGIGCSNCNGMGYLGSGVSCLDCNKG